MGAALGLIVGGGLMGLAVFGTIYWRPDGTTQMKPWKAFILAIAALVVGVSLFADYWGGPIP